MILSIHDIPLNINIRTDQTESIEYCMINKTYVVLEISYGMKL